MKKLSILFLCITFLAVSCKQNTSNTEVIAEPLQENFYKRLEGTIGGDKVTINLQKHGSYINGSFFIQGFEHELMLDTLIGDSLILMDYKTTDTNWDWTNSARLHLKWKGNQFEGNWSSKNDQETLPVLLKETYPEGTLKFKSFALVDSAIAFPDKKNSPVGRLSLYVPVAENKWVDDEMKKAIDSVGTGTWDAIGKRQSASYFKFYKEQADELKDVDSESFAFLNYYIGNQGFIRYNQHGYLVIDQLRDEYTGGAHGYYFSTMHSFDVKNQKKLLLKDIIRADSNLLSNLLDKQFRINRKLPENEPIHQHLFVDKIMPKTDFYFNELGVGFVYHPYEISSYAEGQIYITLPYALIKQYLTPEFANRMGLN